MKTGNDGERRTFTGPDGRDYYTPDGWDFDPDGAHQFAHERAELREMRQQLEAMRRRLDEHERVLRAFAQGAREGVHETIREPSQNGGAR